MLGKIQFSVIGYSLNCGRQGIDSGVYAENSLQCGGSTTPMWPLSPCINRPSSPMEL